MESQGCFKCLATGIGWQPLEQSEGDGADIGQRKGGNAVGFPGVCVFVYLANNQHFKRKL